MKIVESILKKNPCYTAGRTIKVKGLMLHSVGCAQPSAAVFVKSWNKESYDRACVHAFIDGHDGVVYQTLPWSHRGWHGGGASNNTHIGVEMCEPACIKYNSNFGFTVLDEEEAKAVADRTYIAAVELFAYLCKEYSLDPLEDGVIISHLEGHKRGIASNHGDPEHFWKGLNTGYTMDGFRADVAEALAKSGDVPKVWYRVRRTWKDAKSQKGAYRIFENAKKCADANPGYSVYDEDGKVLYCPETEDKVTVPYLVRVSIKNLNIRKGPGTDFARNRYIPVGVYTIVEESDGKGASKWGRLKSGEGWISLDYVTKM